MLIEFQERLHLVDIPTGVATPLLAGNEQNTLISTEGNAIYFFQRTLPETMKDLGIGLTTGEDDKTVVEKHFRPRDVLFRYEVGAQFEMARSRGQETPSKAPVTNPTGWRSQHNGRWNPPPRSPPTRNHQYQTTTIQ